MDDLMRYGPVCILAITTLAGIRVYFNNAPQPLKMLFHICLVLLLIDGFGYIISDVLREQNKWLANLFLIFSILYVANIFLLILEQEKIKLTIQIFYGAFIVFAFINSLFLQGLSGVQTLTFVIGGVFMIFLSGAYFWQLLVSPDNDRITRDPFFWMSFGLLVYYAGNVPFYGMFNYLERNFYDFTVFYQTYISNAFATFLYLLYLIAFLCRKNYPKSY
jgi:hypothetical protein